MFVSNSTFFAKAFGFDGVNGKRDNDSESVLKHRIQQMSTKNNNAENNKAASDLNILNSGKNLDEDVINIGGRRENTDYEAVFTNNTSGSAMDYTDTEVAPKAEDYVKSDDTNKSENTNKSEDTKNVKADEKPANTEKTEKTEKAKNEKEVKNSETQKREEAVPLNSKKTEVKTKASDANGKIDVAFRQGNIGDCALLSSVYSISLTEEGAEAIKNSIKVNKDEKGNVISYDVHFAGVNETYTITQNELKEAKEYQSHDERIYSLGDDDMTLLELAMEKCFNTSQDPKLRNLVDNYTKLNVEDKLHGVNPDSVSYLLMGDSTQTVMKHLDKLTTKFIPNSTYTLKDINGNDIEFTEGTEYHARGKKGSNVYLTGKDGNDIIVSLDDYTNMYKQDIQEADNKSRELLKNFSEDVNNDKTLVFATLQEEKVKDASGKEISLYGPHAYSVLDVKDGIVTLVNPHNTSESIKVNQENLLALEQYNLYTSDVTA